MSDTSHPLASLVGLPGVADAVERARAGVDAVYRHRVMRRRAPEVSSESALRGARASAALAGADWALEEVRRRSDFSADEQARTVGAGLRLSAEVGGLVGVWRRTPLQALARMHLVAAAGALEPERVGRPRLAGEGVIEEPLPGRLVLPGAEEVSARLEGLAELLTRPHGEVPALVVAAVVHGELLTLRPFGSANGLVARAAERLCLIAEGLDPKAVAPAEVGHAEAGADGYLAALVGYASGTVEGVAEWVTHCAEAVALGAREATAVCEAMQRGMI
ncbi:oxidoreductase [Allostreptomyces psammosilenae]|uniref:Fido domain-containing protein n=1 Tax=Allostreptomyces psammosilenae TaxID=1892865 RepID=A0A852ZT78_9ACTN|nr:oxidoreductase [Allostreptomyces psammosilenae]NYI05613.1 hypothetical protein [Allostreptomyces psammosilenae]